MNEKDLRDCFAMFTLCGIVMRGIDDEIIEDVATNAYKMADAMLEAMNKNNDEEELGIAAVKPKRRYPKRPSDL
jgi:hypothetical protein